MSKQKETIYLETSVISAFFDFKKQDQERKSITRKFWKEVLSKYRTFISRTVIIEIEQSDEVFIKKFLSLAQNIPKLEITPQVTNLAKQRTNTGIIRKTQFADALHLAIAVLNKIDYIVSWNYKDIARANQRKRITEFSKNHGLYLTQVATPNDFLIIKLNK